MRKKVMTDYKITSGQLSTWMGMQDEIRAAVADRRTRKLLQAAQRRPRWPLAETELSRRFKERRGRGRRVSQRWIFATMKQLMKEMYPGATFAASRGWLRRCCERLGIAMRSKSNCKRRAAIDRLPAVRQWLARYRSMLSTPLSASMPMDPIWGRFRPERRFNCDQVPIFLVYLCLFFCFCISRCISHLTSDLVHVLLVSFLIYCAHRCLLHS